MLRTENGIQVLDVASGGFVELQKALKALQAGAATEGQQKMILDVLLNSICGAYNLSYSADSNRTAFNEGRRFVGLEIVKCLALPLQEKPNG